MSMLMDSLARFYDNEVVMCGDLKAGVCFTLRTSREHVGPPSLASRRRRRARVAVLSLPVRRREVGGAVGRVDDAVVLSVSDDSRRPAARVCEQARTNQRAVDERA